jgi:lipooligosaccharide transport system ATP-binding protein
VTVGAVIINAENVRKTFKKLKAVDGISLTADEASCLGVLGPNGAGKTTLMKMIYAKIRRDPSPDSSIRVFGFDPETHELEIKHRSGVVPQDNNLDEELNVRQNLQVYARFYGMGGKDASARIDYLLDFLELSEKSKSKLKELSGGMKRRLVIARALLHDPKLLILDEPTTGLDPQVRHLIWDKLRKLRSGGMTVLLTTHYMEEAFQICDRVIIMDKGRKILEGPPRRLLEENIERYVLELKGEPGKDGAADIPPPAPGVRRDSSRGMTVFHSNDFDALRKTADSLPAEDHYLRQANLEDLFLKITGRDLNDSQ